MPDKVEDILKKIHVMFAKCPAYHDSPDRVIVSKHEMFELLEELSEAMYEVLDRYEATSRSREKARLEMDRQAAEIVMHAKSDSDDVHAATLLYTETMLEDMKSIIENTKRQVKEEMLDLLTRLDEQQETLEDNKEGVRSELKELHDGEFYLKMLNRVRDENEKKYSVKDEREEEFEPAPEKAAVVIRVDKPGVNSGVSYSTKKSHKKGKKGKGGKPVEDNERDEDISYDDVPVPKGQVFSYEDFDLDAEYEQWKDEQEGENEPEEEEYSTGLAKGLFAGLFGKKNKNQDK